MLLAIIPQFLLLHTSRAFVANWNEAGVVRRWPLAAPQGLVSTNVVNPTTHAIRYFLASDGYSETNRTAELNAVRSAFAQWQAISGTTIKFEEGGLAAPGGDINTSDNTNLIFWARSHFVNGGLDNIQNYLALTYTARYEDNTLVETDTVYNGADYTWTTDFTATPESTTAYFVESTALHEIGHILGLDHSPLGGSTMFVRGNPGFESQAGLSADEFAAARFLYPQSGSLNSFGILRGLVKMGDQPLFGAVIIAENNQGSAVFGTVTRTNGSYEMEAMPPGEYEIHTRPFEPSGAPSALVKGQDISFDPIDYGLAPTSFLTTTNTSVMVTAGKTQTLNMSVTGETPPFYISRIRGASSEPDLLGNPYRVPALIHPGQSNVFVGVYSPNLPTANATLTVTGDGLNVGSPLFIPGAKVVNNVVLNLIQVPMSVSIDATPGLRSFTVQQGAFFATANGFLEVTPIAYDSNSDGLDDFFQRRYFPVFNAPEASPGADPDGDGFSNVQEHAFETNPTNNLSFPFQIMNLEIRGDQFSFLFPSATGRTYQVQANDMVLGGIWSSIGNPITAQSNLTSFAAPLSAGSNRFYRVQKAP